MISKYKFSLRKNKNIFFTFDTTQLFKYHLKKALTIFTLLFTCIHICGIYPVFKLLQYEIQEDIEVRIERGVPEQELQIISISAENCTDIKWEREGKEFFYKGYMYDVVSVKKENGIIHYTCIGDKAETRLAAYLNNNPKKGVNDDSGPICKSAKKTLKVFRLNYLATETGMPLLQCNSSFSYIVFASPLLSVCQKHKTPPPKRFC